MAEVSQNIGFTERIVEVRVLSDHGTTAIVEIGRLESLDFEVVIKRYRDQGPEIEARCRKEARRTARVASQIPEIVKVIGFGPSGQDSPFFVMEYLSPEDGHVPLDEWTEKLLSVRPRNALRFDRRWTGLGRQLLKLIEDLSRRGYVHRDLKPSNLFVTVGSDNTPVGIRVIDLDTLVMPGDEIAYRTLLCGTPGYMAPEQMRGLPVSSETDVWAVAVILFEVLFGKSPFNTDLVTQTFEARRRSDEQALYALAMQYGSHAFANPSAIKRVGLYETFRSLFAPEPGRRIEALRALVA